MREKRSQTKTIITKGPASMQPEIMRQLFHEGVDVVRMNFSHDDHKTHLESIKLVHQLNEELNTNVAVLVDLQGPKLRIGMIEGEDVEIKDGEFITFTSEKCIGNAERVYMSYTGFPKDVKPGDTILIDDGKLQLKAVETDGHSNVKLQVIHGGILSSKKGVNLPDTQTNSLPPLTEKDLADAEFALDHDIDWIALSFVRTAADVQLLRDIINRKNKTTKIVAKIEKPEAVANIDEILKVTDAIMVARGDLGVEVSYDKVPIIQKMVVEKCMEASIPVIIATQMLESMLTNFRPTRAEATDVSNAVVQGADCLMLSGETSRGKFPIESLHSMQQIIDTTEENAFKFHKKFTPKQESPSFLPDSICWNAAKMAVQTNAKAIVTFTHSGHAPMRISSHRPKAPIFAFTSNRPLMKQLSLVWGVRGFYLRDFDNANMAMEYAIQILKDKNMVESGDIIVFVGSIPINEQGNTNMIKLTKID